MPQFMFRRKHRRQRKTLNLHAAKAAGPRCTGLILRVGSNPLFEQQALRGEEQSPVMGFLDPVMHHPIESLS